MRAGAGAMALLTSLVWGCTPPARDSTPAKVLGEYIRISFNASSVGDKKKMEELLTGDSKSRLNSWSDEQFAKAFLESKRKFTGLKILESNRVGDAEVALTYELSFEEGEKEKSTRITQRKLCTIVKEQDVWRIKSVRGIRESIEYLEELTLP